MKVHLIKAKTIRKFAKKHAESISSFESWIDLVKHANWNVPEDMKQTFGSVDILGKGSQRAVFNVGGNNYRIICKYQFGETESIYSFAGLALMRSITNFAMMKDDIALLSINGG